MGRELGSKIVYVIGLGENPVKIGIADGIRARLSQLQVGCPDKLTLHHAARVPTALAQPIERKAHEVLAAHHRRGEWFNIDHAEAAAVVERLKAEMLAEYQWGAREARWDLLARLSTLYELRRDARAAVWHYRERLAAKDDYTAHANGYVLKHAGMAAYAVFSIVVTQGKNMPMLPPRENAKAEGHLAAALNKLAAFREAYMSQSSAKALVREVNAMTSDKARLRPPSLPPARAA